MENCWHEWRGEKNINNNEGAAISVESCIKWGPTWVITTARNVWGVYKLHGKKCAQSCHSF